MPNISVPQNAVRNRQFAAAALPHLDAVFSRAQFLLRNATDAEDATQECYARALHYFDTYRGSGMRAWLFTILKNLCFSEFARRDRHALMGDVIDDRPDALEQVAEVAWQDPFPTPEELAQRHQEGNAVRAAIDALPVPLREVLVLRELDELSYKEIAELVGVPIGTIMSRLSRARTQLREVLDSAGMAGGFAYADDIDQWRRPGEPRVIN